MSAERERRLLRLLEESLAIGGGMLTASDVIEAAQRREMQIWDNDNALAATQLLTYPRGRIVEVVAVAGGLSDVLALQPRIENFANAYEAQALVAHGRPAWGRVGRRAGWLFHSMTFVRNLRKTNGHLQ